MPAYLSATKLAKIVGPVSNEAIPFVMASGDAFDHTVSHKTDLMRYWTKQRGHEIFITHLRWIENHQQYEISRCALIDLWRMTYNLSTRIVKMLTGFERMWEEGDFDGTSNEVDVGRYDELRTWLDDLGYFEYYLSRFLPHLRSIELSANVRDNLLPSEIPKWSDIPGKPVLDPNIPNSILPFHIISRLNILTASPTILLYMTDFMLKSKKHLTDELGLIQGAWRKKVSEVAVDAGTILDWKTVTEGVTKVHPRSILKTSPKTPRVNLPSPTTSLKSSRKEHLAHLGMAPRIMKSADSDYNNPNDDSSPDDLGDGTPMRVPSSL